VIVDAGVGTASDVSVAMELGCDGVLLNTAIAHAQDPLRMAWAMRYACDAGGWRSWVDGFRASCTPRRPARWRAASRPARGRTQSRERQRAVEPRPLADARGSFEVPAVRLLD